MHKARVTEVVSFEKHFSTKRSHKVRAAQRDLMIRLNEALSRVNELEAKVTELGKENSSLNEKIRSLEFTKYL